MSIGVPIRSLCVLLGVLLFPLDAFAWGPVVHLDLAMQVVTGGIAVAPTIYQLIKRHAYDFLYGALLADFIVGKKHAEKRNHCHNWDVARDLLKEARGAESVPVILRLYGARFYAWMLPRYIPALLVSNINMYIASCIQQATND